MQIVIYNGKVKSWYGDFVDVTVSELPSGSELVWVPNDTDVKPDYVYDEEGFPVEKILKDDPRPNLPSDYRDERDAVLAALDDVTDANAKIILTYLIQQIMKE